MLLEEGVIHLQVVDGRLVRVGHGRPAAEVVASQPLPPEVGPGGVDHQGAVQAGCLRGRGRSRPEGAEKNAMFPDEANAWKAF